MSTTLASKAPDTRKTLHFQHIFLLLLFSNYLWVFLILRYRNFQTRIGFDYRPFQSHCRFQRIPRKKDLIRWSRSIRTDCQVVPTNCCSVVNCKCSFVLQVKAIFLCGLGSHLTKRIKILACKSC